MASGNRALFLLDLLAGQSLSLSFLQSLGLGLGSLGMAMVRRHGHGPSGFPLDFFDLYVCYFEFL